MAKIPPGIYKAVKDYVEKLKKEIPVDKVIIFGSYAKGTPRKDSDVDLAIFSKSFEGKKRVEAISYLLSRVTDYTYDLEPIGYPSGAYYNREDDPFVEEIIKTGIELDI